MLSMSFTGAFYISCSTNSGLFVINKKNDNTNEQVTRLAINSDSHHGEQEEKKEQIQTDLNLY